MSANRVEDLAGVLGHELRNPLASAVTAVALLREMVDGDDPRSALVEQALGDLDRITRLTDGWLKLSRTGAIARAQVDVDELLQRVAVRNRAVVVTDPAGALVDGDAALLERALDNLLANAAQAGARNLRVAAQCLDGTVSIHVEDDAGGIPEQDRARIFQPGWSGRGSCGLGLHTVEETVRAHRGRIQCVPIRRGTRFSIHLPMARVEAALA